MASHLCFSEYKWRNEQPDVAAALLDANEGDQAMSSPEAEAIRALVWVGEDEGCAGCGKVYTRRDGRTYLYRYRNAGPAVCSPRCDRHTVAILCAGCDVNHPHEHRCHRNGCPCAACNPSPEDLAAFRAQLEQEASRA